MKTKGFTLIEALIVIGIITILINIAVPYVRKYYEIYKYNDYVSQVEYALRWSKLEAMSRSRNIGICVENNGVSIYDIGRNRSGFCSRTILRRVRVESGDAFVQISGTSGMGFDPRGLAILGGNVQVRNTKTNQCVKFTIQNLRGQIGRGSC